MIQIKKRLWIALFIMTVLLFVHPFAIKAEEVHVAVTNDNEAVFYLADEGMTTIYKYTISGFAGTSPTAQEGAHVVDASNLTWRCQWITPGNPVTFTPPNITDMTLYASSIQAHKTDWYLLNDSYLYTESHPEYLTNGNDSGAIYYGLSIQFANFRLRNGYHVEEDDIEMFNAATLGQSNMTPAYAYNHLYTRNYVYAPYVSDKNQCERFEYRDGYNQLTNFKEVVLCNAHIWYDRGEDWKYGLGRLSGESSFDPSAGTMTLNGQLFYFGGLTWVDSQSGEIAMESDIPVYVFHPALNMHNISYNANGGSGSIEPDTAGYGQNFVLKSGFHADGYSFKGYAVVRRSDNKVFCGNGLGWQPMSQYGNQSDKWELFQPGSVQIMNDNWINPGCVNGDEFIFYAQWERDHVISYSANGGSGSIASHTVEDGSQFTLKRGFYADGYSLKGYAVVRQSDNKVYCGNNLGWQPMSEYAGRPDKWAIFQPGTTHTLDGPWKNALWSGGDEFIFYAQWELNPDVLSHTISYSANGGSGSIASHTVADGSQFTLKSGFHADGYTFKGYAVVRKSDNKVYGNGLGWQPMSEYERNPGNWSVWAVFQPGTTHTLDAPWKNASWSGGDEFIFCAQWEPNPVIESYTLTVNPNGGIWNDSSNVQTFMMNSGGTKYVGDPIRPGYTFTGWSLSGTGSSMSGTTFKMGTADAVLEAGWRCNSYNVVLRKGTGIEEVSGGGSYSYGDEVRISAEVKPGFHWSGWAGDYNTGILDYSFRMPANDVTLTANAEANEYVLHFETNGGAEVTPIPDMTIRYDETVTLPDATGAYVKYTLDGVNVTSDVLNGTISLSSQNETEEEPETDGEDAVATSQPEEDAEAAGVTEVSEQDTAELAETGLEETPEEGERDKAAYESVYMGWATEAEKDYFEPQWTPGASLEVPVLVDAVGVTEQNGATINLYAVWDDCPWIKAQTLYYSLEQAQSGFITVDEILSHATAHDREDGEPIAPGEHGDGTSFTIPDYMPTDFTQFDSEGGCTENLTVVDSVGNIYRKMIWVYIVDTTATEVLPDGTTRFINEYYYYQPYDLGGLRDDSVWKTAPEYVQALTEAFKNLKNDTPIESYHSTYEENLEMREYIDEHGFGNSKEPDALRGFYDQFMAQD